MNTLKALRIKAGYKTVKEAAKALEVSTALLYKVESGKAKVSIRLAMKMSKVYGCSLKDIYRRG